MTAAEIAKHPLFVAIASLIIGAIVTSIVSRIRSRMARLRYFVTVNRVGISTTDPVFGNIKVSWNNQDLRNLHIATVNFENISNVDIGELDIKVYAEVETHLLSERTWLVGTSYNIPQSDSYQRSLAVQPGGVPSELQWRIYFGSREYHLKAFNRFQKGQLTYLCTRPNDDQVPALWLESSTKGVNVRQARNPTIGTRPLLGVPIAKAALLGLVTAGVLCAASILFIGPVWLIGLLSLLGGLFASLLGSIEYRIYDSIKKHLST
jgi:hypothetical protein